MIELSTKSKVFVIGAWENDTLLTDVGDECFTSSLNVARGESSSGDSVLVDELAEETDEIDGITALSYASSSICKRDGAVGAVGADVPGVELKFDVLSKVSSEYSSCAFCNSTGNSGVVPGLASLGTFPNGLNPEAPYKPPAPASFAILAVKIALLASSSSSSSSASSS
ncbi:hypothetical protein WICMUC_003058 [Wickerhamomyces mucosus]|uniref:Uncharacterized protein n=1 Tax=Wickerhamomyces mucosus TaxID=1378264 RepID=A0A9P8TDT0_9ASCO|nr:hypothetical protein WICMUC_003058 [Wickerhamomyces mucosus]